MDPSTSSTLFPPKKRYAEDSEKASSSGYATWESLPKQKLVTKSLNTKDHLKLINNEMMHACQQMHSIK